MKFSPAFQQLHRTLIKGSISIEQLASIANPAALGLNDKRDFYEPVRFALRLTAAGDALNIGVPVAENENWLGELKRRTAATLGIAQGDIIGLEFRTINEVPLQSISLRAITSVGHLNVYAGGKLVRLAQLPTVPVEFSVTKRAALTTWVKDTLSKELPTAIATELAGKDAHEVDMAISQDGVVMKMIRTRLAAIVQDGVAQRFHVDSPPNMPAAVANATLDRAARHVLRSVRAYVKAGSAQIQQQIAMRKAAATTSSKTAGSGTDTGLVGSILLLEKAAGTGAAAAGSDKLFRSLMTDALAAPQMRRAVMDAIYRAPIAPRQGRAALGVVSDAPTNSGAGAGVTGHPWYRHVHETLLPLRGSYPSDYMARHTKQNMSINAPFAGDALQTYQRYHLYAGRMPVPPGLVVRAGAPQPIECHNGGGSGHKKKHHNKKHESEHVESSVEARRLIPISEIVGSDLPPLARIAQPANGHIAPRSRSTPSIQSEMRSRLVALGDDMDDDDDADDNLDAEILAQGPELPPLDDLFK